MDRRPDLKNQIELFLISEGFLASSILFTLVKLGVFELLGKGDRTAEEVAHHVGARRDVIQRLLRAGVAVKLLECKGPAYRVTPALAPYLASEEGEGYLGHWFRFQDYWYSAFSDLATAVRQGGPARNFEYVDGVQERREFTLAMHDHASLRGKELARFLDTSACTTLLDAGCGPGTYAFLLGQKNPGLELHLIDLPEVLKVAREIQARHSLANKVHYHPLDLTIDAIPGSFDLVLVSNALHVLGEAGSRKLIKRLFNAVNPGGSLVIQAQFLDDGNRGGRWPALLDLAMLCTTPQGRNHSVEETRAWMQEAGFTAIEMKTMSVFNANSYLRGYRT